MKKFITISYLYAENIGFEPMVQLPVHLISSQAQSTSLAIFLFLYSPNIHLLPHSPAFSVQRTKLLSNYPISQQTSSA